MAGSLATRRLVQWASPILACLLTVSQSFGQATPAKQEPPKDPKTLQLESIVASARAQLQSKQWEQAMTTADQALKIDDKFGAAHVVKGMAFNGKGDFDKALAEFEIVTGQAGRDPVLLQNRADAYAQKSKSLFEKGDYLPAIDAAYFATLEKGDHLEAHLNRGLAYMVRNEFDKAIRSADRAIAANDKSAEAYSLRALAYVAKKNNDQATKDVAKALELAPGLPSALARRGAISASKGDLANALKDLDSAIAADPSNPEFYCHRAVVYGMQQDLSKAAADLEKALKISPNYARANFQKGIVSFERKEFDAALVSLDKALEKNTRDPMAWTYRGHARLEKGDTSGAKADFDKALELDENLVPALTGRSQAFKKLAMTKESAADSLKAKRIQNPPKKDDKDKKTPEKDESPEFIVKSKPVDQAKLRTTLASAKEIDRLVQANYGKHGVSANPKTSDAQFLRRIYLDIVGRIPTYVETRRFLGMAEPNKRSMLIDELLNSEGYASHSFNYWADVLRYTDNLNVNVRGEPYRQWIKQSLAENKPWDKMVFEILTAEGLIWKNPATGYFQRDSGMPLDNMNNTVRIFLGTRIGCAQCHDHPFDRWTQKEFYQVAAFTFGTTTRTGGDDKRFWTKNPTDRLQEEYALIEQEEEDRRNNSYRFDRVIDVNMMIVNDLKDRKITLPKDYQYTNGKPGEAVAPKSLFGENATVLPGEAPRQAFARWVTSKQNPRFALTIANRLWKQAFGVGQIEPVDDMMDGTVAENPELMKFLESEMKRLNFDMKEYLRIIYNSDTYQQQTPADEVPQGQPYHFTGPILRRMTAEQAWDSFLILAVPDDYHEAPADERYSLVGMDLLKVKADDVLEADNKTRDLESQYNKRKQLYTYKGVLLARASELPSPVPPNHFLRMFGQSDRELISASSTTGSVPQVLLMFNGPITHMLLEKNSTIYNNVMKKRTIPDGVRAVFMTVLNREPTEEEQGLAIKEVTDNGPAGYGNVIWALVNTREFLFIQ